MKDDKGVSSVVGTLLMVAVAVVLGSITFAYANGMLADFQPEDTTRANIVGEASFNEVVLRHMGGEEVTDWELRFDNGTVITSGDSFVIGEKITIPKTWEGRESLILTSGKSLLFLGSFEGSSGSGGELPPEEPPGYSYLLNHSIGIRITLPGDSGSGTKIFCLDAGEGNFMIVRDMEGNVMDSYSLLPIEDWHFTPSNPTTNGVYMWIGTNPGSTLDIESHREEKIPLNYSIITKFALEHTTGENSYRAGLVLHNESPEKLYIMVFRQNVVVFKGENTLVSVPSDTWENNEEISLQVLVRERFTTIRETIISVAVDGGWVLSDYPISWE